MTSIKDSLWHDMQRDPEDLEHEADHARTQIERTVEALERRLAPGGVAEWFVRALRHNGAGLGGTLLAQFRSHPVPAVLAGIGLSWLAAVLERGPEPDDDSSVPLKHRAATLAGSALGFAASAVRAGRRVTGVTPNAETLTLRVSRVGMHGLRGGYRYLVRQHPLLLVALVAAAGAALGTLLSSRESETEDRWSAAPHRSE